MTVCREIRQTGNFILYPSRHGAIGDVKGKASRDSWPRASGDAEVSVLDLNVEPRGSMCV